MCRPSLGSAAKKSQRKVLCNYSGGPVPAHEGARYGPCLSVVMLADHLSLVHGSIADDMVDATGKWAHDPGFGSCSRPEPRLLCTLFKAPTRTTAEGNVMTEQDDTVAPRATNWQIVMLFFCIYVLGAVFVETIFTLPPQVSLVLARIDTIVCIIFIVDFVFNLVTARSKREYLKWGWIDLISSIPNIQILRLGRFVRVIRILRILRAIRSTKLILRFLFANRAKGTFASVAMISFIVVVFSSIAILNCETTPEANIKTASDALWWAFSTITTVGYGDRYPITTLGRVVAVILMTTGVGLFGTFTACVASFFIQQSQKAEEGRENLILAELQEIRQRMDRAEGRTTQEAPVANAPRRRPDTGDKS